METAVGEAIKRIRTERGLTQDDIARAGRGYGLRWTTARVGELERGEKRIPLAVFVVILAVLSDLTRQVVKPADLLGGEVHVTSEWSAPGDFIGEILAGRREVGVPDHADDAVRSTLEIGRDQPMLTLGEIVQAQRQPASLAEERAAKRLGIEPSELRTLSLRLWARTLDEQAALMAGDSPQARGHATRKLLSDLRDGLAQKGKRRG